MWKPVKWIAGADTAVAVLLAASLWIGLAVWQHSTRQRHTDLGEGIALLVCFGVGVVVAFFALAQALTFIGVWRESRVGADLYVAVRFVAAALILLVALGFGLLAAVIGPFALLVAGGAVAVFASSIVVPLALHRRLRTASA